MINMNMGMVLISYPMRLIAWGQKGEATLLRCLHCFKLSFIPVVKIFSIKDS